MKPSTLQDSRLILLFLTRISSWLESIIKIRFKLRYLIYRIKYQLPSDFRFNGLDVIIYGEGKLSIGERCYIGRHSSLQISEDSKITIGKQVSISHYVSLYTEKHQTDKDFSNEDTIVSSDIEIGDYCWIGIKSTIVGPVKIGENTIISSNSLVNRNIPPHAICMGIPVQVVKFKPYLQIDTQIKLAREYRSVISPKLLEKLGIGRE